MIPVFTGTWFDPFLNNLFKNNLCIMELFSSNKSIFMGKKGQFTTKGVFKCLLQSELMNHHKIWYGHNWHMWGSNWEVHFTSILFDLESIRVWEIQKGAIVYFCVALSLYRLFRDYFLFSSLHTLKQSACILLKCRLIILGQFCQFSITIFITV